MQKNRSLLFSQSILAFQVYSNFVKNIKYFYQSFYVFIFIMYISFSFILYNNNNKYVSIAILVKLII